MSLFRLYSRVANVGLKSVFSEGGTIVRDRALTATLPSSVFATTHSVRYVNFFITKTAEEVWASLTGVSNAGRKRGRGKSIRKVTDLNKGVYIGQGKANIRWPGLNAPILQGRQVIERKAVPPDPEREKELIRLRDQVTKIRNPPLPPLVRGFSGSKFPGQSVGTPERIGDYEFEGFDTRVLEHKMISTMTGNLGRKTFFSAFVATGNKNGLVGFGLGKSMLGKSAIKVAKNKAGQRLVHVPLYENRTVYHNMYSRLCNTRVFIHPKHKGYGLKCHRVIRALCQLIGIEDLHCKVEGSTKNVQNLTKAFINALVAQETHQALADRSGLHVVEYRPERAMLPTVIAAPSAGYVAEKKPVDEHNELDMNFDRLYYDGKVELEKPPRKFFYHDYPSHKHRLAEDNKRRNQSRAQLLYRAGFW